MISPLFNNIIIKTTHSDKVFSTFEALLFLPMVSPLLEYRLSCLPSYHLEHHQYINSSFVISLKSTKTFCTLPLSWLLSISRFRWLRNIYQRKIVLCRYQYFTCPYQLPWRFLPIYLSFKVIDRALMPSKSAGHCM